MGAFVRSVLFGTAAASAFAAATGMAQAGGFAVREQSAQFQGSSFAGNAAGGALSSMFWNPAAVGQFNGINTESVVSVIFPASDVHALPGSTLLPFGVPADAGNIGIDALVPASYGSMQLGPNLVLGLSLNAPFGLTTKPDNRFWAGYTHATTSQLKTYNLQPVLAYRVGGGLIVAAGLQIELVEGRLKKAAPLAGFNAAAPNAVLDADDVALGFTAGVLWSPNAGTTIGLGFRSSIDHDLEGSLSIAGVPALGSPSVTANVKTPETVTLSLRQALTSRLTGLATIEWANWSRLQSLDVYCTSTNQIPGGPPTPPLNCNAGDLKESLHLGWHDSWFIAGGVEYAVSPALAVRTGLAWEKSPIRHPDERTVRTPDADRIWASVGASWKVSANATVDLAYTHVFVEDARIDRTEPLPGFGGVRLVADVDASADIVSVGFKYRWGGRPEPMK